MEQRREFLRIYFPISRFPSVKIIASVHSESHETPHTISPSRHLPDTIGYLLLNDSNCRSLRERTRRRSAGMLVLDVVVVTTAAGLVVDSHPHGFGGKLVSCLFAFSINYSHRQCFPYPKPNQDEDLRWLRRNKQQSRRKGKPILSLELAIVLGR
jgi:hypothetical protein